MPFAKTAAPTVTMVLPIDAVLTIKRPAQSDSWRRIYEVDASASLPTIDLSDTFAAHWSGRKARYARFLTWMTTYYPVCVHLLRGSMIITFLSWFLDVESARTLSLPLFLLGFPTICLTFASMSRPLMKLLCLHAEFWIATVLNVLNWSLLSLLFNDIRVLPCVMLCGFTQLIISLDANFRTVITTLRSSFFWLPATICTVLVCLQEIRSPTASHSILTPQLKQVVLATLVNIAMTLGVFGANKTYKRRKLFHPDFAYLKLIPCAMIRTKMVMRKWCFVNGKARGSIASARSITRAHEPEPSKIAVDKSKHVVICHSSGNVRQQLRIIPFARNLFDVRHSVVPHCTLRQPLAPIWTWFVYTNGAIGLLSAVTSVYLTASSRRCGNDPTLWLVVVVSFVTTVVFLFPFVCNFQRHLLQLLLSNFDFWFASFQFVIASLTIADLLQWKVTTSLGIVTWNLWFHWVLSLDALLPTSRQHLRFRKWYAVPVMVFVLCNTILVLYGILTNTKQLHDRMIVFFTIASYPMAIQTKPFLLYRLVTLLLLLLRLLYAIGGSHDAEMIVIKGGLEYYSPMEVIPPLPTSTVVPVTVLQRPMLQRRVSSLTRL